MAFKILLKPFLDTLKDIKDRLISDLHVATAVGLAPAPASPPR